ncbi:DUF1656 domain-containing protein [Frateuria defendens]|uniref:DUF1656 domain-containing protein n=1 Tax=Frateuria defendens TaxID=2219559 RepID=UPI00066FB3F3|nr:DUF1656 domain-containing protein [Frateuria defendens]
MPREFALMGVLFPGLLPMFLGSLVLMLLLDHVFARTGLYRQVWHPSLFRLALFVCLFGTAGLFLVH